VNAPASPAFLDLARGRRSVRSYSPRPVGREKIERCLEAAGAAPSACDRQPWRFVVVVEPGARDRLAEAAFGGIYRSNSFARRAPVLVVILAEPPALLPRIAGRLQGKHYPLIDVGIAGEHFILQAAELGLGTCWLGWFDQKRVGKLLNVGARERPVAMISAGYPDPGAPPLPDRRPGKGSSGYWPA